MHGDWREMRTVFNAVGLVPRKPPSSQRPDSGRRNVGNGLSPPWRKHESLARQPLRNICRMNSKGYDFHAGEVSPAPPWPSSPPAERRSSLGR
jgi:hypothetical protein